MKKYRKSLIIVIILGCLLILKCLAGIVIKNENLNNSIDEMQNVINNEIQFYEMTEEEIIELKTAKIIEQNEIDEQNLEQEVEDEGLYCCGRMLSICCRWSVRLD